MLSEGWAIHWISIWISILASLDHENKIIVIKRSFCSTPLSCVANASSPSVHSASLRPRLKILVSGTPVRIASACFAKHVEEEGRRGKKCSLWSWRKVKRILWCGNTSVSRSLIWNKQRYCARYVMWPCLHLKGTPFKVHTQSYTWPSSEGTKKKRKMKSSSLLSPPHSAQLRTDFTVPPHLHPAPTGIKK